MILGIGGKLSSGKTVTSVKYAYDTHRIKKKKVIANIKLNFESEYMPNEAIVEFIKRNYQNQSALRSKFQNSVLILDEITNIISARKSTTVLNELITNYLMMAGKLDQDIIFTYQILESQVDLRLRDICNIYANCFRVDRKGRPLLFQDRIVNQKIYIAIIYQLDLDLKGVHLVQKYFDPERYFPLYDTREINLMDTSKFMRGGIKDLRRIK